MGDMNTDNLPRVYLARLTATDFKGLQRVEIVPHDRVTIIAGPNGAGKSSIIEGIHTSILGAKYEPEVPVRRGATGYKIKLDFSKDSAAGEAYLEVIRTNNRLEVNPVGKHPEIWGTNQKILNSLLNKIMLDPVYFMRLGQTQGPNPYKSKERKEQVEILKESLGLDFSASDAQDDKDAERRTEIGREVRRLDGQIAAIPVQPNLPGYRVDTDAIHARINEATRYNNSIGEVIAKHQALTTALGQAEANEHRNEELCGNARKSIEDITAEVETLGPAISSAAKIRDTLNTLLDDHAGSNPPGQQRIAAKLFDARDECSGYIASATGQLEAAQTHLDNTRKTLKAAEAQRKRLAKDIEEARAALAACPLPTTVDLAPLMVELRDAEMINREIERRDSAKQLTAERNQLQAESDALERAIKLRAEKKREAIANAKMPLPGLSFSMESGKEQIFYDGGKGPIPLQQWGEAMQLKVSIAIGLASNPKMRLVCIPNGEAFDRQRIEELREMALELDFYVIMAMVESSGSLGIYLEEGEVSAVDGKLTPEGKRKRDQRKEDLPSDSTKEA